MILGCTELTNTLCGNIGGKFLIDTALRNTKIRKSSCERELIRYIDKQQHLSWRKLKTYKETTLLEKNKNVKLEKKNSFAIDEYQNLNWRKMKTNKKPILLRPKPKVYFKFI